MKSHHLTCRRLVILIVFLIVAWLAIDPIRRWLTVGQPVYLVVSNATQKHVTGIHVSHEQGAMAFIPDLAPRQTVKCTIRPSGGSNLRVSYWDAQRTLKVAELDVYVGISEPSTVRIEFRDDSVTGQDVTYK